MIEKEIMHCKTDADDWFIICPGKIQQGKSFEMNIYLIVSNIWNSVASNNILVYHILCVQFWVISTNIYLNQPNEYLLWK